MRTTLTALLIAVIDLATKTAAELGLLSGDLFLPTKNPALALGVANPSNAIALACGIAVVVLVALAWARTSGNLAGDVGLGLLVGGCLGNLVDRAANGAVRDFLVGPFIVFNVADVAIVLGLTLYWIGRRSTPRLTGSAGRYPTESPDRRRSHSRP